MKERERERERESEMREREGRQNESEKKQQKEDPIRKYPLPKFISSSLLTMMPNAKRSLLSYAS